MYCVSLQQFNILILEIYFFVMNFLNGKNILFAMFTNKKILKHIDPAIWKSAI